MVQILTVNRRSHHPIEILVFFADNIGGFLKASSVLQPGAIFIYRNTYFLGRIGQDDRFQKGHGYWEVLTCMSKGCSLSMFTAGLLRLQCKAYCYFVLLFCIRLFIAVPT